MKRILTLSSWKVFLFFILPVFFPENFIGNILTTFWMGAFTFCTYFLGNSLFQKLPPQHDLKINRFNFHFLFAAVYLTIAIVGFGGYSINQDNIKDYGWTAYAILPLHLFTMYCMFYTIWFIAKAIGTIVHNRPVIFESYSRYFFALWFFPIGVWFVQRKIRNIFSTSGE